jgi:3-hydroxybutyryl-CoA dehydrogenase
MSDGADPVAPIPAPAIGVVGAGAMGAGIAQLAVEHGHETWLLDPFPGALDRAHARIRSGLERRAAKLGLDADAIEDWVAGRLARLRDADSLAAVAEATDIVIEAAIEDLAVKHDLFRRLDAAAPPATILATNTSALAVGAIAAAAARHPERVLGLHFFNPAPLMALVEVVAAPGTDAGGCDRAAALVRGWGRTAVRSADAPGFIVNRVNRPFTLEALTALERGEAPIAAIDAAVRAAGFPMGPFALMDLIGIDVNLAAARGVFEGFVARRDPAAERFRPSPIQERLVAEGRLGRKSGSGFFRYDEGGRAIEPAAGFASVGAAGGPRDVEGAAASITERIRLAIDAEAWRAIGEGVATEADVDLALRLGAAHPEGPIAHTEAIGGRPELVRRLATAVAAGAGPRLDPAGVT